jgi:hypothetical protein
MERSVYHIRAQARTVFQCFDSGYRSTFSISITAKKLCSAKKFWLYWTTRYWRFETGTWPIWNTIVNRRIVNVLHVPSRNKQGFNSLKKNNQLCGARNRRFITVSTRARHRSLSWANWIYSTLPQPISLRSILIPSFHLRLDLSSGLFPDGFPTNTLYSFLSLKGKTRQNIYKCCCFQGNTTSRLQMYLMTFRNIFGICSDKQMKPIGHNDINELQLNVQIKMPWNCDSPCCFIWAWDCLSWQGKITDWRCCPWWRVEPMSLYRGHQRGYCLSPRWYTSMESHGGLTLKGENKRILRKTCPSANLSHMDWLGRKPRLSRWEADD